VCFGSGTFNDVGQDQDAVVALEYRGVWVHDAMNERLDVSSALVTEQFIKIFDLRPELFDLRLGEHYFPGLVGRVHLRWTSSLAGITFRTNSLTENGAVTELVVSLIL